MWGQWLADSSDCRQIYHLGCWQISDGGSWNSDLRSQTVESGDDDRRSRCGFARRRVIVVGATRIICAEPTPRPGRANKKKVTSDFGAEPLEQVIGERKVVPRQHQMTETDSLFSEAKVTKHFH